MINNLHTVILLILATLLSGCATTQFDRAGAKNLATAGQFATKALQQQTAQVTSSLIILPITFSVNEILNCRGVKDPVLRKGCISDAATLDSRIEAQRKILSDILEKRQNALAALNGAYTSFGDLATYDAGQSTATAIDNAFGKINTLAGAMGPILPAGVVIAPITATMSKVFGGLGALAADQRQAKLILPASKDLHVAVDSMIKVLKSEKDSVAMKSLMGELQDTVHRLESSTLDAGLGSSMGVLTTFYSKVAPDIALTSSPEPANTDLAAAAAKQVLKQTMSTRKQDIESTYERAISALLAVRAEHQRLETQQGVDVSLVLIEAQHLRDITKNLGK